MHNFNDLECKFHFEALFKSYLQWAFRLLVCQSPRVLERCMTTIYCFGMLCWHLTPLFRSVVSNRSKIHWWKQTRFSLSVSAAIYAFHLAIIVSLLSCENVVRGVTRRQQCMWHCCGELKLFIRRDFLINATLVQVEETVSQRLSILFIISRLVPEQNLSIIQRHL